MSREILEILAVKTLHGKGRVQVPKEVRELLDVADGDRINFCRDVEGNILIKKGSKPMKEVPKQYVVTGR